MRKKSLLLVLFSVAAFCLPPAAKAAIIFDNLNLSVDGDGLVVDLDIKVALGFTITTTQTGDWTFRIRADNPGNGNPGALVLQLVNNNGGEPGAGTPFFISGAPSGSFYTYSGSGTLSAGSTYWLVASTADVNEFYTWIDRGTYTTQSGATLFGVRNDLGDGDGWQFVGTGTHPLSLEIGVTAVPEPAQTGAIAALFLIACSLVHTFRRRRLAAKATTQS